MSVNFYQLGILLGVIVLIVLPIFFVRRAAKRRRSAIESGELVLSDKTNTLSIVGFVLSFVGAIAGIVVGHVALSQIKRTNERGWGFAVAALWIGYASVGFGVLILVAAILVGLASRG